MTFFQNRNSYFTQQSLKFRDCCFIFLFCMGSAVSFSQTDTVKGNRGTIKVIKGKDSTYIKATLQFYKFSPEQVQPQFKKMTYNDLIRDIQSSERNTQPTLVPHPKSKDQKKSFDYTAYFKKHPETSSIQLPEEIESDTVRLIVYVTKKGEVIFNDLTPSQKLGKIVATYDAQTQNYKVDVVHFKVRNAFMALIKQKWEPAYILIPQKDQFKKVTVIKPQKHKVNATGVLTVILSKKPLTQQEWK